MAIAKDSIIDLPVVDRQELFDKQSGTFLEKLVFNQRGLIMLLCALVTLALGFQANAWSLGAKTYTRISVSCSGSTCTIFR